MGHSQVVDENNALYGYKTELIEQLRAGELPKWFVKNRYALPHDWEEKSLLEIIDAAAERARELREEYKENHEEGNNRHPPSQVSFTRSVQFRIRRSLAPDSVIDKMHVTREQAIESTGRHKIKLREYRVRVDIGVRGGIKDLQVVRDVQH